MAVAVGIAFWSYLAPMASARALKVSIAVALLFLCIVLVGHGLGWISRESLAEVRAFAIIPGLPVAATLLSEMALRDGITHRTLLYPLLGPVSRTTLAVVRTAVTGLVLFTGTTLVVLLLRVLERASWGAFPRELLALLLASLAYTGLFGLVHLITRRGLIVSLILFGLFDNSIGRLPFSLRVIAPSYHLRYLAHLEKPLPIPIDLEPGGGSVLGSTIFLLALAAATTALSAWFFSRKNLGELC